MLGLTDLELIHLIGFLLVSFIYGLYSGIFVMYLQYQTSKKDRNKTQNIIFCSICVLYILCGAVVVCEIAPHIFYLLGRPIESARWMYYIQLTSFGCCDFIGQFILIYRCWIVWGCNIRVVIFPSILAFAFLVSWLTISYSTTYSESYQYVVSKWAGNIMRASFAISLVVNALVTGLIVLRIFKVFREVKAALDGKILGVTGGSKLRRIIFILIESGMALFLIQLARFVVSCVQTDTVIRGPNLTIPIHQMFNGMIPTIIAVRTSMGLSFDEKKSMEEVAIESLCFTSNHPNSVQGAGSINIVDQDSRDINDIGIKPRNDVVER